jgi:hypothetical protein
MNNFYWNEKIETIQLVILRNAKEIMAVGRISKWQTAIVIQRQKMSK